MGDAVQGGTQHRTVCGDKGKVDAERRIKGRHDLFQSHFHKLHQGCNDENKGHRAHVFQVKALKDILVDKPGNRRRERHREDYGHSHAHSRLGSLGNPKEGTASDGANQNVVLYQGRIDCDQKQFAHAFRSPFLREWDSA